MREKSSAPALGTRRTVCKRRASISPPQSEVTPSGVMTFQQSMGFTVAIALPLILFATGMFIGLSAAFLPLQVAVVCCLAFLFAAGGIMGVVVHWIEEGVYSPGRAAAGSRSGDRGLRAWWR